ncbi:DUF5919 domain-containing protein [Lentzea sp. BCCO 10_0061]|uniref:DUF5919 domain-containing protein n=1 Tax=Lentzea sokolovensis TaxID=3095429 RepID=A0ABU4V5W2_9PSEU|nr:DUF5919 domain-containing protein [Lentzea sp. BCCO 10_0061]MDX8147176.1 DUF5919 domain-containing protein [Lentzea sp. BCCO 10_0061]
MSDRGWTKRVRAFVADDNLDLYLLALVGLVFTILGITGLVGLDKLASAVLALLAILAFSQIKSRKLTQQITRARTGAVVLRTEFPPDLIERRAASSDILLIGLAMTRTVQGERTDLPAILKTGGRVRVAVLDPTNESLMETADRYRSHPQGVRQLVTRIQATLDDLLALRERHGGRLEIRVLQSIPSAGFNCLDRDKLNGVVCVQHYEFHPEGEATPIMALSRDDEPWYRHFGDEAERLWESGTTWPLSAEERSARAVRPAFSEDFGTDLAERLDTADEVLITGVARDHFVNSQFGKLEARLRNGQVLRFLLLDPVSPVVDVVAARNYAGRSGEAARERIRNSLRLLGELKRLTDGNLSVRLTSYPLSTCVFAVDSTRPNAAVYAEYYTYRAAGEPKFVLHPGDSFSFYSFLDEAEALWAEAEPHAFD